jgi:hypothetical protein
VVFAEWTDWSACALADKKSQGAFQAVAIGIVLLTVWISDKNLATSIGQSVSHETRSASSI